MHGAGVTIGRDPRYCNIVLQNVRVSREHCKIWYDNDKHMYAVKDCSENGVFIEDGLRIKKDIPIYLKPQSVIYIATIENSFKLL